MEMIIVALAAAFAGFVDAIVGGGGLILMPALFAVFPNTAPATLFGVNKSASVWGTAAAALTFARRVNMRWHALIPGAIAGLVGGFIGAWVVTLINPDFLRKILPAVLAILLIYTIAKKDLGREHAPTMEGRKEALAMGAIGLVIGFYDGFFGPGTGSFFIFLFVRWLGYDFLNASASAKFLNVATNTSALILFAYKGHVWWHYAIVLAVANVAGSMIGSRLALKHGSGFVRKAFIGVVLALIAKTGYDAFIR
jgi:uncharacterized membrane protein YfcA